MYVCAKCGTESDYYVTNCLCTEDGKLKVYLADIQEDREVLHVQILDEKRKLKEKR